MGKETPCSSSKNNPKVLLCSAKELLLFGWGVRVRMNLRCEFGLSERASYRIVFRLADLPREMHSKFTLKGNWIRNLFPQGWNLYSNINTTKTFRGSLPV